MTNSVLQAVEASDENIASEQFQKELGKNVQAWEIHLSLFSLVQRVLNPPFINPHLPKMYAICRELTPFLKKDEIPGLVHVEVVEYARRPKLEKIPKPHIPTTSVTITDIESAIKEQDRQKTAALMYAFYAQEGGEEFSRRILLLGSGYLDHSLGHSVSCTAFILKEMMERVDEEPWPTIATLADYFCKGRFYRTPTLRKSEPCPSSEAFDHQLLRATSGGGIENIHHTITLFALERVRRFFNNEEYNHLISQWITFMGDKAAERVELDHAGIDPPSDYKQFYEIFSELNAKSVVASLTGLVASQPGRQKLGSYLIKGVIDQYKGNYNPHYFTGLGSTLWVVDRYRDRAPIVTNALHQYIDFFFEGIRS